MDIMHACFGPPEGAARGIQLALAALIFGGPPLAVLGLVLSAITRRVDLQWASGWRSTFKTGFVVQLSSVVLTAPVAVLFQQSFWLGGDAWDLLLGAWFPAGAIGGGVALPAWRRLIAATAPSAPISIRT